MAPQCPDFEAICEFALGYLIAGKGDARRLAASLVETYPDLPALELVLVLSSAASALESTFSNAEAQAQALDAWRIAALLAVDVHLMTGQGPSAGALMEFWRREDDFFLRAG